VRNSEHDDDVQLVVDNEMRLLEPNVRSSADHVEKLLHTDFVEFGASGRKWERHEMVAALLGAEFPNAPIVASEVTGTRLADEIVLVTYVTQWDRRRARRSSLWRRTDAGWRLYFHQGTLIPTE
jgi:hypothetical protein